MPRLLAVALLFIAFANARAQFSSQFSFEKKTVEATLIADTDAVKPGQPFMVGLLFKIIPGWHTYWRYAGDFGLPTTIDWTLPPGWKAGAIQWPLPEVKHDAGDIVSYAYSNEVLHLITITPPEKLDEKSVTLKVLAKWLMCEKECVPGQADLTLTLNVSANPQPANAAIFAKYRALLPQANAPPFAVAFNKANKGLQLKVGPNAPDDLEFYPLPPDQLPVGHIEKLKAEAKGTTTFSIPIDNMPPGMNRLDGLLVERSGNGLPTSWLLQKNAPATAQLSAPSPADGTLWHFLLFGFLGGMILNIMPCVLPVISLKILGFVHQAGQNRTRIFRLGLAFTAGVFVWFGVLAAIIVSLQAAGKQANWAFQFQNPWFVAGMFAIVLIFALNLLGAFEFILPGGVNDRLNRVLQSDGYSGAFAHGVFATILGSACTAPLLGSALGFALSQPPPIVFAVFGAIAAGMAFPYFLLTAQPAWLRFLPKPGMWMIHVKQAMGVLMLLTAMWLGWVLWQQQTKVIEPFGPQLARALKTGRPVFVDFTADWCLNCKANERLVLHTTAVQEAFKKNEVLFLVADWTRPSPDITALLKQFGRAGVPLYVFYPAGSPDQPRVLPEVLTREIVLDAL